MAKRLTVPSSLIPRLIRSTRRSRRKPVREQCMSIVIRTGKPQLTESLCNSCYWAHIQRGFAESEEVILCAFLRPARLVPFKVSQCTDYNDKRVPSRSDMEEIAWIIRTKDVNRNVGFAKEVEFP